MPGGRPVVNWIRAQEALPDEHEVVVVLDDDDSWCVDDDDGTLTFSLWDLVKW